MLSRSSTWWLFIVLLSCQGIQCFNITVTDIEYPESETVSSEELDYSEEDECFDGPPLDVLCRPINPSHFPEMVTSGTELPLELMEVTTENIDITGEESESLNVINLLNGNAGDCSEENFKTAVVDSSWIGEIALPTSLPSIEGNYRKMKKIELLNKHFYNNRDGSCVMVTTIPKKEEGQCCNWMKQKWITDIEIGERYIKASQKTNINITCYNDTDCGHLTLHIISDKDIWYDIDIKNLSYLHIGCSENETSDSEEECAQLEITVEQIDGEKNLFFIQQRAIAEISVGCKILNENCSGSQISIVDLDDMKSKLNVLNWAQINCWLNHITNESACGCKEIKVFKHHQTDFFFPEDSNNCVGYPNSFVPSFDSVLAVSFGKYNDSINRFHLSSPQKTKVYLQCLVGPCAQITLALSNQKTCFVIELPPEIQQFQIHCNNTENVSVNNESKCENIHLSYQMQNESRIERDFPSYTTISLLVNCSFFSDTKEKSNCHSNTITMQNQNNQSFMLHPNASETPALLMTCDVTTKNSNRGCQQIDMLIETGNFTDERINLTNRQPSSSVYCSEDLFLSNTDCWESSVIINRTTQQYIHFMSPPEFIKADVICRKELDCGQFILQLLQDTGDIISRNINLTDVTNLTLSCNDSMTESLDDATNFTKCISMNFITNKISNDVITEVFEKPAQLIMSFVCAINSSTNLSRDSCHYRKMNFTDSQKGFNRVISVEPNPAFLSIKCNITTADTLRCADFILNVLKYDTIPANFFIRHPGIEPLSDYHKRQLLKHCNYTNADCPKLTVNISRTDRTKERLLYEIPHSVKVNAICKVFSGLKQGCGNVIVTLIHENQEKNRIIALAPDTSAIQILCSKWFTKKDTGCQILNVSISKEKGIVKMETFTSVEEVIVKIMCGFQTIGHRSNCIDFEMTLSDDNIDHKVFSDPDLILATSFECKFVSMNDLAIGCKKINIIINHLEMLMLQPPDTIAINSKKMDGSVETTSATAPDMVVLNIHCQEEGPSSNACEEIELDVWTQDGDKETFTHLVTKVKMLVISCLESSRYGNSHLVLNDALCADLKLTFIPLTGDEVVMTVPAPFILGLKIRCENQKSSAACRQMDWEFVSLTTNASSFVSSQSLVTVLDLSSKIVTEKATKGDGCQTIRIHFLRHRFEKDKEVHILDAPSFSMQLEGATETQHIDIHAEVAKVTIDCGRLDPNNYCGHFQVDVAEAQPRRRVVSLPLSTSSLLMYCSNFPLLNGRIVSKSSEGQCDELFVKAFDTHFRYSLTKFLRPLAVTLSISCGNEKQESGGCRSFDMNLLAPGGHSIAAFSKLPSTGISDAHLTCFAHLNKEGVRKCKALSVVLRREGQDIETPSVHPCSAPSLILEDGVSEAPPPCNTTMIVEDIEEDAHRDL